MSSTLPRTEHDGGTARDGSRRPAGRGRWWALLTLAVAAAAVLGALLIPSDAERAADEMAGRPSIGTVGARYDEMRATAIARLDAELGTRPWGEDLNGTGSRAGCADYADASVERATLPLLAFDGTYPEDDWQRSLEIVTEVAAEYGFTTRTAIDRPGDVEIIGEDAYGAQYSYGMAKNTIFGVSTGCHRRDDAPVPD